MRILFLTQFFQPEPLFKGLPFARALRERGHSVEVLTGFPNYPGGKLYPGYSLRICQREVMDGIPVLRVPLYPSHDGSGLRRTANYLSFAATAAALGPAMVRTPDVIYVYNLVTLGLAWRLMRLWHGCAVVLDVQDLWPESVSSSGMLRGGLGQRALGWWCRSGYRSADRIVVQSPGFKRHLEQDGVPGDRIDVIYNWCDESDVTVSPDEIARIRREAGFEGKFNVLFAGTMGKAQALDCVIDAASTLKTEVPEVLFTLVGGGVEVERLKAKAAGLPNVQFLPRCSSAQASRLAAAADALLVHLRDDPLFSITIPSKTQTYLHAGKPLLMGGQGDAVDMVKAAGAGLVFEPENGPALAGAVRDLAQTPADRRAQMGASGRAYYLRTLRFDRAIERFEQVFAAACGNRSGDQRLQVSADDSV